MTISTGRLATLLGSAFQIAYVTSNLDAIATEFTATLGLTAFDVMPVEIELTLPDNTVRASALIGLAGGGGKVFELIQPTGGHTAIFDHGTPTQVVPRSIHHLGALVEDLDTTVAALTTEGIPVAARGTIPGLVDFAYLDTSPILGHHLEVMTLTEQGAATIAHLTGQGAA